MLYLLGIYLVSPPTRKNAIIERKQGQIDQFNKKIDQLSQKEGGEEVGPLEVIIWICLKFNMAKFESTHETYIVLDAPNAFELNKFDLQNGILLCMHVQRRE